LYGRLLIRKSDEVEASKFLNKAIELNPKFPWSYNSLAKISLDNGDYVGANNTLEECINICGDHIPSYIAIVYCFKNLYMPEKTITLLKELILKFPSEIDFILELAKFYSKINKSEKAEILIKNNIEKFTNDYKYHRLVYQWANCTSSFKLRKKLLHSYWKNYPNSPLIISVYIKLFEIYKSENIKKALIFAGESISYKTKIKRLKSIAYENLIEFYKRKNENEELIQIGSEMINSDFANPNILNELGEFLLEKGNIDIAILLFEKACNSCEWENLKNNVFFGTLKNEKQKDNIIKHYSNASYYYLGGAYFAKEEFDKAISCYSKTIEGDSMLREDALIDIAKCHISLNNESEAVRILGDVNREYGSKKAFDLLKETFNRNYEDFDNFPNTQIDNVKNTEYFSKYRDKIVIFGLHSSTCNPCLRFLKMSIKLRNKFSYREDIVFVNLFEENKNKLVLDSMIVDKSLFRKIEENLNIWRLPHILIIDKKGNIIYRIIGFEEEMENFQDLEYKLELLLNYYEGKK
jgi:tetratricopeptide (TPR) repeat protein